MKNCRGFTLIETIIAAGLIFLILGAALFVLNAGLQWWQRGWDRMDAQQNARVAMAHITREIQSAREIINGSDAGVLIIADAAGEQIKYLLAGETLQRAVKKSGSAVFGGYNLLAYGVKKLEFAYDRPEMPERSKMVTIHLVTYDKEGRDFAVSTAVALRLKVMNPGR